MSGIYWKYFLICIPVRILLAMSVIFLLNNYFSSVLLAIIGLGFLYAFVKHKPFGAFGHPSWWHPYRPFHSLMFGIASYAAARDRVDIAGYVTLSDLIFGIMTKFNQS